MSNLDDVKPIWLLWGNRQHRVFHRTFWRHLRSSFEATLKPSSWGYEPPTNNLASHLKTLSKGEKGGGGFTKKDSAKAQRLAESHTHQAQEPLNDLVIQITTQVITHAFFLPQQSQHTPKLDLSLSLSLYEGSMKVSSPHSFPHPSAFVQWSWCQVGGKLN